MTNKKKEDAKGWRRVVWYIVLTFVAISIVSAAVSGPQKPNEIDFSQFVGDLEKGRIESVEIRSTDKLIVGKSVDGKTFQTYYVDYPSLVQDLKGQKVSVKVDPSSSGWVFGMFMQAIFPFLLIAGLWFFIFRQASGANNQALSFGKSKSKAWEKDGKKKVTFKDIAGVDEALEELKEIVDFLKHPKKYQALGAKIPKGALLMGPPGTGKTLLAKAVAGEADVPFFNLSGSEFVEMFVGVGASRVRDLFQKAKKEAPSIIFVDEIDAVGRHRGAGLGGGHDEREQTLNQLLVEMDGFADDETVIVIAATNRSDILDPALLRPGRFDRQITVDRPDLKGREDILKIHSKGKKLAKGVKLSVLARGTSGFTGADLANLMNEGALLSARHKKKTIGMFELEESIERVIAGPERKSRVMSDEEKRVIAYHEVGHAMVAALLPKTDPVHKISILPRGRALGYTLQLPKEDKFLVTREEMLNELQVLLGGRAAEALVIGEITSGASNDIERATEKARRFVCTYGMSEKLGLRKYGAGNGDVFLGKQYSDHSKDYSEETAHLIDEEIHRVLDEAYAGAMGILKTNRKKLDEISGVILKKEVLVESEFLKLLEK